MPTFRQQKKFLQENIVKRKLHILHLLCRAQSIAIHFSDFCRAHFFWTHCRDLPVWVGDSKCARKFGHARRLGHLTRELTLNNEFLSQFLQDRKVLWMTLEQLFELSLKLPFFDSIRAICALLRVQNQLLVPSV